MYVLGSFLLAPPGFYLFQAALGCHETVRYAMAGRIPFGHDSAQQFVDQDCLLPTPRTSDVEIMQSCRFWFTYSTW